MQRILVLEKDQETADRLAAALNRVEGVSVSVAPTMREACLLVAQMPQDLAFIPFEDAGQLLRSLRALQPDLKMVLTTDDSNQRMLDSYEDDFQGLLHTGNLESELPDLLSGRKLPIATALNNPKEELGSLPSLTPLAEACQEIGVASNSSPVQMTVLSSGGQVVSYCGQGEADQAATVADLISKNWQKRRFTAQLQYLHLPDYYDARLVYSRKVADGVLSLVAEPDVPISDMRELADRLAYRLSGNGNKSTRNTNNHNTFIGRSAGTKFEERPFPTFAIAWRPVKPLPIVLQNVVQECVASLAAENGCRIRHLSVTPTVVHLVVVCPPGKTAAWAVFLLKSEIDKEIQHRFGTQVSIWQKGFFATESEQPLSESELQMLLRS